MKLKCIHSPVKALMKEGQVCNVIKKFDSGIIQVSDRFGVPLYVAKVQGSESLYQCKLGGKAFVFQEYTEEHARFEATKKKDAVNTISLVISVSVLFAVLISIAVVS